MTRPKDQEKMVLNPQTLPSGRLTTPNSFPGPFGPGNEVGTIPYYDLFAGHSGRLTTATDGKPYMTRHVARPENWYDTETKTGDVGKELSESAGRGGAPWGFRHVSEGNPQISPGQNFHVLTRPLGRVFQSPIRLIKD